MSVVATMIKDSYPTEFAILEDLKEKQDRSLAWLIANAIRIAYSKNTTSPCGCQGKSAKE